jgi:phosphoribosylglycinamide formyltransferase-1
MGKKRLAIFASGRGSNFQVINDHIKKGFIPAEIGLLVTNKVDAGAIEIASQNNIKVRIFIPKEFGDSKIYNDAILEALQSEEIDFIILAGYLKMIGPQIVSAYANKIMNIHPALLPSFGGKGMYGHHVHDAVFKHGVKISGATVHLVNNDYDAGPIVMQKCINIAGLSSPAEIAGAVLKIEHDIYPQAVKLLVEEKIRLNGRRIEIAGETVD